MIILALEPTIKSAARMLGRVALLNRRDRHHHAIKPASASYQLNTQRSRDYKWCRYCKNTEHEIEECRKRRYNNQQREQGNFSRPSGNSDASRAGNQQPHTHPIRAIETEEQAMTPTVAESQS